MILDDPVFLLLLGVLVLVFFFGFLLLRRTLLGFKEGVDRGKE